MVVSEFLDKVVITSAKRGSRSLQKYTLPLNQTILDISNDIQDKDLSFIKELSKNKKVFLINREPISHISSGLVNYTETFMDTGIGWGKCGNVHDEFMKYLWKNEGMNRFRDIIYASAERNKFHENRVTKELKNIITQKELLSLLNFWIGFINKNYEFFFPLGEHDLHISSVQGITKKIANVIENGEIVDLELQPNLFQYMGFKNINDMEMKSRFSQRIPKQFFKILIEYIYYGNMQYVVDGFKKIYGKCSVIRSGTLKRALPNPYLKEYLDNEIKIYNELKQYPIFGFKL